MNKSSSFKIEKFNQNYNSNNDYIDTTFKNYENASLKPRLKYILKVFLHLISQAIKFNLF